MLSFLGSPAYTPETNGSIIRSNVSAPEVIVVVIVVVVVVVVVVV